MGLSLWIIPREKNPFTTTIEEMISDTVPRQFLDVKETEKHKFFPHVNLFSDIDPENGLGGKSPQEWLDGLRLPDFKAEVSEVVLTLDMVEADDAFAKKMSISILDDDNLKKLAAACKQQSSLDSEDKAQAWARSEFKPYFALLCADVPTRDVKPKIPLIEMKLGFAIGDIFACCGGTLCMGGHLALVDTSKPTDEWTPIAKRETKWVMWRATHNLI